MTDSSCFCTRVDFSSLPLFLSPLSILGETVAKFNYPLPFHFNLINQ